MAGRSQEVLNKAASKSLKPALGTAWQYAKVECAPPMTQGFLSGPAGQKLEDTVSAAAEKAIAGIQEKIRNIDAEEARVKREKEAEIKAAQEKLKAEAAKKRKDAELKALEEQKIKEKAAADKKAEAAAKESKAEDKKPKEKPKEKPKRAKPKKPAQKKK